MMEEEAMQLSANTTECLFLRSLGTCRRWDRDTAIRLIRTQLTGEESFHTVPRVSVVRNLNRFSPSTQSEKTACYYGTEKSFPLINI